jgi:hypothetical protein
VLLDDDKTAIDDIEPAHISRRSFSVRFPARQPYVT